MRGSCARHSHNRTDGVVVAEPLPNNDFLFDTGRRGLIYPHSRRWRISHDDSLTSLASCTHRRETGETRNDQTQLNHRK
jgi:hypothetical protein